MEFLAQWLMWYLWNWIVRKWCNFSREPNLIVFRFKYFSHLSGGKLLNLYGIFLSYSKHYRVNTKSTWTSIEDPDVEGVEYGPGKSWAQPTPWWETLPPSQFVQWYFSLEGDVQHIILWQNIIMDTPIDYLYFRTHELVRTELTLSINVFSESRSMFSEGSKQGYLSL